MNSDLLLKIIIPLCSAGIGAIIGATLAYRNQYRIELKRDKRAVIQNLMMYRNVGAHELDWIKALNVRENVSFPLTLLGISKHEAFTKALKVLKDFRKL